MKAIFPTQLDMKNKWIPLGCALFLAGAARVVRGADAPTISVDKLYDSRSNSQFGFGDLSITLGVKSQTPTGARATRGVATSVIDGTGQQLVDAEKYQTDWDFNEKNSEGEWAAKNKALGEKLFKQFPFFKNFADVDIEVKNPARAAQTLREIAGRIEYYYPERDPKSVVIVKNVGTNAGQNLDNATLKTASIKLAFLTANRAKHLPKGKAREMWLEAVDEDTLDDLKPDQLLVRLEDPRARLVAIEVETAQGQTIESEGNSGSDDVTTYDFNKPIAFNARLKIYVATPKSVTEVPFQLNDVALP